MEALEFHDQFSFIKGGLVFSDWLTTVSPTYAREIRTPAFGYGLEGLLNHREDMLTGILNGVDYALWNPGGDPHIPVHYNRRSLLHKAGNKRALLERLGLPVDGRGSRWSPHRPSGRSEGHRPRPGNALPMLLRRARSWWCWAAVTKLLEGVLARLVHSIRKHRPACRLRREHWRT